MLLYKYLALPQENELEKIFGSIKDGNVKFSFLHSLNDPSEALFRFAGHDD